MTKGKHAAAAAVRHEVQARDSEIATYQHAVARLTAENKQLKADMRERERSTKKRERELLAMVDAAAAPRVAALEHVVKRRTEERDHAVREFRKTRDTWTRAFHRLVDHLSTGHGYHTTMEAVEAASNLIRPPGSEEFFWLLDENLGRISPDGRATPEMNVISKKRAAAQENAAALGRYR